MIIPAIDLIDGKVVRLFQGDYNAKTEYQLDPVDVLTNYANQGADWLHIVDLTGAKDTSNRQLALIKRMVATNKMKFQAGGGIRSEQDIEQLLNVGVNRVVIGSVAVKQPELVKRWFHKYGAETIVLALDVQIKDGRKYCAVHGWQEDSGIELEPLLQSFVEVGARHVLCTDISKDGTLSGANNNLYAEMVQQFPDITWQASGGIGSIDDVISLKPSGVQSVILGRSLLEGKLDLGQAIDAWQC